MHYIRLHPCIPKLERQDWNRMVLTHCHCDITRGSRSRITVKGWEEAFGGFQEFRTEDGDEYAYSILHPYAALIP